MVAPGIADAVQAYTGLSPAAAVTILALMLATYLLVSSSSSPPKPPPPAPAPPQQQEQDPEPAPFVPLPEPVQVGQITLEQLGAYDGKDPSSRSSSPSAASSTTSRAGGLFYGPQGPYSLFAGRDATRALALMSFDPNDLTGDLEGLSPDELEVLQDWEDKFKERYPKVGHLASANATDSNQNGARLDHEEENE